MAIAQIVGRRFMLMDIGGLIFEGCLSFALQFDVLVRFRRRKMILVRFTFNTRRQQRIAAVET